MSETYIDPLACVEEGAQLGDGCKVWRYAHIRSGAVLGKNCVIGMGAYIDTGVHIGDNCKIQNYACIYAPAELGDGVFVGPHAVLTNDKYPRAVNADGTLKQADDWHPQGVIAREGAAIGAGAIVLPGVTIGAWAMIGAGAVVVEHAPAQAVVVGNPARIIDWVESAQ